MLIYGSYCIMFRGPRHCHSCKRVDWTASHFLVNVVILKLVIQSGLLLPSAADQVHGDGCCLRPSLSLHFASMGCLENQEAASDLYRLATRST